MEENNQSTNLNSSQNPIQQTQSTPIPTPTTPPPPQAPKPPYVLAAVAVVVVIFLTAILYFLVAGRSQEEEVPQEPRVVEETPTPQVSTEEAELDNLILDEGEEELQDLENELQNLD